MAVLRRIKIALASPAMCPEAARMMLRVSDSELGPSAMPGPPLLQRTRGDGRIAVERAGLKGLRQAGAAKILFPRNHQDAAFEAVLLNTAGGLTGGDRIAWEIVAGEGAHLRITTQAAERVYRSSGDDARVDTRLKADAGATLEWLPQETILFDGARLARTLSIDLAEDASLIAAEAVVLGRRAHGERVRRGALSDQWRVRRGGRLIYADAVRMQGDIAALSERPGTLGGAQAFATVLLAGTDRMPIGDIRAALPEGAGLEAAASALPYVSVVRLVAAHGDILRPALTALLHALRGGALPRLWQS